MTPPKRSFSCWNLSGNIIKKLNVFLYYVFHFFGFLFPGTFGAPFFQKKWVFFVKHPPGEPFFWTISGFSNFAHFFNFLEISVFSTRFWKFFKILKFFHRDNQNRNTNSVVNFHPFLLLGKNFSPNFERKFRTKFMFSTEFYLHFRCKNR
jgi:hypothetical protein